VADRDLARGLPQIELADLPGPIHGPLVGARRQVERADLAHIVIDDRLAAAKPKRLKLLPNPDARQRRLLLQ
jgi:hypothetical protein